MKLYALVYTSSDALGPHVFTTWNANELDGVDDPHADPLIADCLAEPDTLAAGMIALTLDDALLLTALNRHV